MQRWVEQLQKLAPDGIVLTLVGNKCDVGEQRQVSSETCRYIEVKSDTSLHKSTVLHTLQVPYEEGQEYAAQIRAGFFETSAKEGTNIQQMFGSIGRTRHILAHFSVVSPVHMVLHCVIRTLCQL